MLQKEIGEQLPMELRVIHEPRDWATMTWLQDRYHFPNRNPQMARMVKIKGKLWQTPSISTRETSGEWAIQGLGV